MCAVTAGGLLRVTDRSSCAGAPEGQGWKLAVSGPGGPSRRLPRAPPARPAAGARQVLAAGARMDTRHRFLSQMETRRFSLFLDFYLLPCLITWSLMAEEGAGEKHP